MQSVSPFRSHWQLPQELIYLNHGSFGPSPLVVQQARQAWTNRLEANPMGFFTREMGTYLDQATSSLADFVGCRPDDLVFVDNATIAMNYVAHNTPLKPGDEVLLGDHEYGAVMRIWRERCKATGAKMVVRRMPLPWGDDDAMLSHFFQSASRKTRMIVLSHITSPTALVLPIEKFCAEARRLRIPICIDGPHAPAVVDLNLKEMGCTYYCASLHKWMCAPFGSGFLYVSPQQQQHLKPQILSWGRSLNHSPPRWQDELNWLGTRDPASFLAVPTAITFLTQTIGLDVFRAHAQDLILKARRGYQQLTGLDFNFALSDHYTRTMMAFPLPKSVPVPENYDGLHPLQIFLSQQGIEIPITRWQDQLYLRVSAHLYNCESDLDALWMALDEYLHGCRHDSASI